jgi:hypothetical protein
VTPLLLLACSPDPGPGPTTWLAAGTVRRGRFEGHAFLGELVDGQAISRPARDRASPTAALEQDQAFLSGAPPQTAGSAGPIRLLDLQLVDGRLAGEALGQDGAALLWSGPADIRPMAVQHGTLAADRERREREILLTSLELEPPRLDCGEEVWTADHSELGTLPLVYSREDGEVLAAAWATTHTRSGQPDQHGTILFLETTSPSGSSQTAPYLGLCVDGPALDVLPTLWVRIEGRPHALVSLRCDCLDERWALIDVEQARAVLWSF